MGPIIGWRSIPTQREQTYRMTVNSMETEHLNVGEAGCSLDVVCVKGPEPSGESEGRLLCLINWLDVHQRKSEAATIRKIAPAAR